MSCDHNKTKIQRIYSVGGRRVEVFFECSDCHAASSQVFDTPELHKMNQQELGLELSVLLRNKTHTEGCGP